jgi:hypothetical protein
MLQDNFIFKIIARNHPRGILTTLVLKKVPFSLLQWLHSMMNKTGRYAKTSHPVLP